VEQTERGEKKKPPTANPFLSDPQRNFPLEIIGTSLTGVKLCDFLVTKEIRTGFDI